MTRFRILAGFGSVADEEPTIDTALMLARALEADIAGYFVEDTDLLNLAALPFAKVVRPADRSVREMELSHMERAMARAAGNWKRALHASAGRARVRCSFETIRGAYSTEIARTCATTDLVVVNPVNLPHRSPDALIGLLRNMNREAAGTVLLPENRRPLQNGPLVVIAAGGDQDKHLFDLVARIARATGAQVLIHVAGGDEPTVRAQAEAALGTDIELRGIAIGSRAEAAWVIVEQHPSLVLLEQETLPNAVVEKILADGGAPMLFVHTET